MTNAKKKILAVLVCTVAIVALAMSPALAKDSKNKKSSHSSAKVAAETAGHAPEQRDAPKAGPHDSEPGRAWKTVGGTVKHVESGIYTVPPTVFQARPGSESWGPALGA